MIENEISYKTEAEDSGLQCLVTICAYYQIPVDKEQVIHKHSLEGKKLSSDDLIRIMRKLKFKVSSNKVQVCSFPRMTMPAIIKTNSDTFVIVAKADGERALILYPFETAPTVVSHEELEALYGGNMILMVPRVYTNKDVKFGFKWFIPTIIKYKRPLLEVLLAAFIMQLLGIFSPLITQSVIDKVLAHNSYSTLDVLSVGLVLIILFETILSISRNYVFTHTSSKVDVILSCRLLDHLFKLPLRYFENRRVGETIAKVRELENIRRFLTGVPMMTLLDTLFTVVYIAILFFYSVPLTLITLASLPILISISVIITPVLKDYLDEKFQYGSEQQSYLVESVTGVQTIKSFAIEPSIQKKWEGHLANYAKANFKTTLLSGNTGAIAQCVQKVFDVAILWYGAKLAMEGKLTVGQLVAFRMLSSRVSGPVLRLVQMWQDFQQTALSVSRLGDIFNTKKEPALDSSQTRLPEIKGEIRFDKVRFRYNPSGSEVIKDMGFLIRPNRVVGIVGRSGSGKSTISKLIQRLYIPEGGKILIDGTDLALADPVWLRKQIGIVLQENFLFNASVRENIALQNPAATMEEITRVAKIAGAHEFVLELTEGYDTLVGERGTGLSGGQKQRIAIARALLSNPKILIFDEATSSLDYESERMIQNNLKEICKNRTVLIIAHRLSTLKDADDIMVIDKGRVAEYGPRTKLIETKGLFYHLLSQQQEL